MSLPKVWSKCEFLKWNTLYNLAHSDSPLNSENNNVKSYIKNVLPVSYEYYTYNKMQQKSLYPFIKLPAFKDIATRVLVSKDNMSQIVFFSEFNSESKYVLFKKLALRILM